MTERTVMRLSLMESLGQQVPARTQSIVATSTSRSTAVARSSQTNKRSLSQLTGSEGCGRSQKQRKLMTPARGSSRTPSLEEDSDVGDEIVVDPRRTLPKPRNTRVIPDESDDEEKIIRSPVRECPKPRNRRVIPDDSDDEETIITSRPRTASTHRKDSVMDLGLSELDATFQDTAPQSEAEPLAEAEVKIMANIGKKGQRRPTSLTARLRVYMDYSTSCRLEYDATFHLDDASADSGSVQVAHVHAWRILKQKDWQEELLNLKLKNVDPEDDRFECARLLQTLYNSPSALRKGASNHLDLADPKADLMHVGIVYVEDDHQRQGLVSPVLRSFRQLLTLPTLLPAFQHFGAVLLCPGKFNDDKAKCWNDKNDQQVTVDLTEIYRKADTYGVVMRDGILPKLRYVTTILGRMAEDK